MPSRKDNVDIIRGMALAAAGARAARFFALLPCGRACRLQDLTKGFIADYRGQRRAGGTAPATVNRDLCALAAFFTWCESERGIPIARPRTVVVGR